MTMSPSFDSGERTRLLSPSKNTFSASERAIDLLLNCDDTSTLSSSASSSLLESDTEFPPIDIEREAVDSPPLSGTSSLASVIRVVAVLLVGAFMVNADGSLVLATHSTIASQFHRLGDSSWLFTAFMLAGAATQALVSGMTYYLLWNAEQLIYGSGLSVWKAG